MSLTKVQSAMIGSVDATTLTGVVPAANGGTGGTNGAIGFKNRIINGNMVINQRGSSSYAPIYTGVYTLDRWYSYASTGTIAVTQSSDAPAGFSNSWLWTTTSGGTRASGDYYEVAQFIEGYNMADLNWGTANAKTVTVSFWVKSSVTGVFGVLLRNSAGGAGFLNYVTSYTISAANTWEYKTITIPGPTTGTWDKTTGRGIEVWFDLGSGSAYQTTSLNTWLTGSGSALTPNTQAAVGSVTGATWAFTGCQLEVGTAATNYDFRSIGTELGLCQRYYAKIGLTSGEALGMGMTQDSYSSGFFYIKYPVTMRSAATLAYNYIGVTDNANGTALATSIRGQSSGKDASNLGLNWTNPGWTVFYNPMMVIAADATGYISMSAEL